MKNGKTYLESTKGAIILKTGIFELSLKVKLMKLFLIFSS